MAETKTKKKEPKEVKSNKEKAPRKEAKPKKEKTMEETLWDSANKLRGTVESSEYKHVVLD